MKRTLWEGGIRALAFVAGPRIHPRGELPHLVHVTDLMPTLLAATVPDTPGWKSEFLSANDEWYGHDGMNLWPLFSGDGGGRLRTEILVEAHPGGEDVSTHNGEVGVTCNG